MRIFEFLNLTTNHKHFWIIVLCIADFTCNSNSKSFYSNIQSRRNNIWAIANSPSSPSSTTTTAKPTVGTESPPTKPRDISIGPCTWAIDRTCPDSDILFYLYTRRNLMDRQFLHVDETLEKSNITSSHFDPHHPTKIVIHGYNSDMFLHPLHIMRDEYLARSDYNMIYVDWSILSPAPCYISAVYNTRHAGACVAQLVERILDYGSADIHVIGFSLGAQLSNYVARNLATFQLPRITALDPAMPLFVTANNNEKLDASDAAFVDVIHTNALVQGKLERCGHADFYMNGGIMQPGCSGQGKNPFACSHQRAPTYFLESIRSNKGFWGWPCSNYLTYLLGMCPPTNQLVEAGENIRYTTRGMFLIDTNDTSPYALGKIAELSEMGVKIPTTATANISTWMQHPPLQSGDPLIRQVDQWGKIDSNFNNLPNHATPFTQYLGYGDNWAYFSSTGTADITNSLKDDASVEEQSFGDSSTETRHTQFNWMEYKRNLTDGYIDQSIFKLPHIQ